jgi:hypothetical protein
MPVIVAVLVVATVMLPLASGVPAAGCTCIPVVLPMISVSAALLLVTVSVRVMVPASVMASEALEIFLLAVKLMLGMTAVLNWKPDGALRIKVTFVPTAKSALAPSAMVAAPNVVQAGDGALAALSADMLLPPVAAVTVAVAKAVFTPTKAKARANKKATRVFLVAFKNCVFLCAFTIN